MEWTKAEGHAMPVINDPEGLFILRADNNPWPLYEDTEGWEVFL